MFGMFKKNEGNKTVVDTLLSFKPMIEMATGKKIDGIVTDMITSMEEMEKIAGSSLLFAISLHEGQFLFSIYQNKPEGADLFGTVSVSSIEDIQKIITLIATFKIHIQNDIQSTTSGQIAGPNDTAAAAESGTNTASPAVAEPTEPAQPVE